MDNDTEEFEINGKRFKLVPVYPGNEYRSKSKCENCPWSLKMKNLKEPYVGDTPCTWCPDSPFRVTC